MGLLDRFRQEQGEKPPVADRAMRSASGRGHTAGFIDQEEFNDELRHPDGHAIYDKMYRTDGDVRQVVSLVCNPITGGTWDVEPHGGELADDEALEHAEFVHTALWDVMEPNLIGHLGEFLPVLVRSGFTPGEVPWMGFDWKGERKIVPRTIALRLPRTIEQFEQDRFGRLTRIKQMLPTPLSSITQRENGTPNGSFDSATGSDGSIWLKAKDLVYYRLGAEGDNWEGQSLLRPAYKHWLLKDSIERIDAVAQEREALGVPICYPPMGATDPQLTAAEEVLAAMRTNEEGYILAPGPKSGAGHAQEGTGWLFEVIGYDRTGSGRDPMPSLEYHTLKIAAAFISEFMRLGHGQTGARATAQVQADPFLMSVEALVSVIEGALNRQIVVPLIAWNFPGAKNPPKLKMSLVDSTSLQQLADFVQKLVGVGALIPDQQLEAFLRARADLPPSDPKVVAKRKAKDEELRREILVGPPDQGFDKPGANAKPGSQHGTKDSPGSKPGARGAASNEAKTTDEDFETPEQRTLRLDVIAAEVLAEDDALPEYVVKVATELITKGMSPMRAIQTAREIARRHCDTGRVHWPGLSHLGLDRDGACAVMGDSDD